MPHVDFAHRKNENLYHPAFFDSRKVDYCHALTINRTTLAVYVAYATHKGKKGRGLLRVPLLVKRRRFCSFCLFKPGFCEFLAKNLFKMRYYAIFRLFLTVFAIKRRTVPRCGAFMKEKKAFSFPIYNAGQARLRFHLMKH